MPIFHITRASDWADAEREGAYRRSTLDATLDEVGYIHASTAAQVADTAHRFYRNEASALVVLVIDEAAVAASGTRVAFELASNGDRFPHIYGALDPTWVTEVRAAHFDDAGAFVY